MTTKIKLRALGITVTVIGALTASSPAAAQAQTVSLVSNTQTEWNESGTWKPAAAVKKHRDWRASVPAATWIWTHFIATPDQQENGATVTFRRIFTIPDDMIGVGTIKFAVDNEMVAYLNGEEIGSSHCFSNTPACLKEYEITAPPGENTLTFEVTNHPFPGAGQTGSNPAGFVYGINLTLEESQPDPIVLVPGITVSQNKKLLYKDEEGGEWKFAFGHNVYKGLIKKLETAGYEQGKNLFVAHYDWRNPAIHNADKYLAPIIQQAKQTNNAAKVDIVAHSFGGIVSRAYIQGDSYKNDVDQLITMGTPHEGAADAYVAWEGGIYPEGWFFFMRERVNKVEEALRESRNAKDLDRPGSFRSFFPSLRDMLPLNDFVQKDGQLLAVNSLTEHNQFLQTLNAALDSIDPAIKFLNIGSQNVPTLDRITVTNSRTHEDIQLNRWRDGRADPIPPPLDSINGDARVLLSSARITDTGFILNGTKHHKIPDEAQNLIFNELELAEQPSFFSDFADRIFGITILSPLEATIKGPNGELLSKDTNTFGDQNAEYDDDPLDPDDPADITILDPPEGDYTITYTGTGDGDYTIITTYADDDETVSSVHDGSTVEGDVFTQAVTIEAGTTSLIDDRDYQTLMEEIDSLARQAHKDKLLKGYERANIIRPLQHMKNDLRIYDKRLEKNRLEAALSRLESFYENIDELRENLEEINEERPGREDFVEQLTEILNKIERAAPPL